MGIKGRAEERAEVDGAAIVPEGLAHVGQRGRIEHKTNAHVEGGVELVEGDVGVLFLGHGGEGGVGDDAGVVAHAAAEEHAQIAGHVGGGGIDGAGEEKVDVFVGEDLAIDIRTREVFADIGKVLDDGRIRHAHAVEEAGAGEDVEGLSGEVAEGLAEQDEAGVVVGPERVGGHEGGFVGEERLDEIGRVEAGDVGEAAIEDVAGQAGMVGQDGSRGDDAVGEALLDGERGKGMGEGGVEIEQALFGELHGGERAEGFGAGADHEDGVLIGRDAAFEVGVAEAGLHDDVVAVDEREAHSDEMVGGHEGRGERGDASDGVGEGIEAEGGGGVGGGGDVEAEGAGAGAGPAEAVGEGDGGFRGGSGGEGEDDIGGGAGDMDAVIDAGRGGEVQGVGLVGG